MELKDLKDLESRGGVARAMSTLYYTQVDNENISIYVSQYQRDGVDGISHG
jgi:hypothetical protein